MERKKLTVLLPVLAVACLAFGSGDGVATKSSVKPKVFEVLPLGSVRPEGWLRRQLEKQADGLTGHAEEIYADIGQSDWLTGANKGGQYAWERGPYYAKGMLSLAFVLDDALLKEKAKKWVETVLASQRADGDFGPKKDNWWANMIALHYLRDWAEATGDSRVEGFLRKYFDYQAKRLLVYPLGKESAWAACRVGDEIEVALWLYDRTGDAKIAEFARFLASQASDWTTFYHVGGDGCWEQGYRAHIVNFMQGLKLPAQRWRLFGEARDFGAYRAAFAENGWAMGMHGRIDRMVNGSEPLAGRSPSQGTELCAIAERILSCRETVSALGDVQAADDLEIVAYNSLPACLGDDGKGIRYYLLLNQPQSVLGQKLGFECNGDSSSSTPGPHAGFGCCRSNFHFAWPKFVQSMWMRRDGGLAAVAYGPSTVKTLVAGREVELKMQTDYPFNGRVTVRVVKGEGKFPIFVRVPGWTSGREAGTFSRYERNWKPGDEIKLSFPMEAKVLRGLNESVGVRRGPLVYALKMAADISEKPAKPEVNGFPVREYRPKGPWNYALLRGRDNVWEFRVVEGEIGEDPFRHGRAPIFLKAKAVRAVDGGWGTFRPLCNTALPIDPPPSPLKAGQRGPVEEITLVPIGCTQIRITLFPWMRL